MSDRDLHVRMRWISLLGDWREKYGSETLPPVDPSVLEAAESVLGMRLPPELRGLYQLTNGLRCDWFVVLPIEDHRDVKRTWDGLLRANRPDTCRFLAGQRELLSRFLVFAQLSGGHCAVLDRRDGSIWFEEADQLSQTDLGLEEFVFLSIKEASGRD